MTLTMFLSFTGYLLPWDQLAIWAVTVGSNMARAHPFIGHEGQGSLASCGDINLVHIGSDVRVCLDWWSICWGSNTIKILRYTLYCCTIYYDDFYGRSFLANPEKLVAYQDHYKELLNVRYF